MAFLSLPVLSVFLFVSLPEISVPYSQDAFHTLSSPDSLS